MNYLQNSNLGGKYVCDDNLQTLTSARYSNQGRNCCHWKDFVVHCDDCSPAQYNFIGRTNSGDNGTPIFWDNDNSPSGTYGFTSNDGNVSNSFLGNEKFVTFEMSFRFTTRL